MKGIYFQGLNAELAQTKEGVKTLEDETLKIFQAFFIQHYKGDVPRLCSFRC